MVRIITNAICWTLNPRCLEDEL